MPEVAHPGEHHRQVVLVRLFYNL
ncbi:uncharacterized protein METZ01_LOCUS418531, partial [marine metagenome]